VRTPGKPRSADPDRRTRSGSRRLLWSLVVLMCALLTVVASACGAAPAPAAAHPTTAAGLPPGGVPGVPVPTVQWADAGDGYQEATVQVPYDYARPHGRTLGLHLVRLPAADPAHRIGSLFVNFGGPGAPAAGVVRAGGKNLLPAEVLARYDLVGVDPRGTGKSRPVRCTDSTAEQLSLPYATGQAFPTDSAEQVQAVGQATRLAVQCRARNGNLLNHVGTLTFARDLDVLRAALGDPRINLLGFSYGTFLGQVLANTFPDRTGALVLDGVVDPAWASGAPGSIGWIRANGDIGSWETLQRFFQLCAQAGQQRCAFAADGDPEHTFAELAARLRNRPLEITLPGRDPRPLGYDDLIILSSVMLSSLDWPALGQFLHAAQSGDAQSVAEVLGQVLPPPTSEYNNYVDANAAIACGDTDNPRDPRRYGAVGHRRDATVAHYTGSRWAYLGLDCAPWLGRSTERHTGPWTARTRTPVLLLATRYDPNTPYRNAVRVHQLLPNSALLTVDGVGHAVELPTSSCAAAATTRYLLTGATPPPGTVCGQDFTPFDQPAA
jgi:pimeloyl-ACP methyl ester carboxylesterase